MLTNNIVVINGVTYVVDSASMSLDGYYRMAATGYVLGDDPDNTVRIAWDIIPVDADSVDPDTAAVVGVDVARYQYNDGDVDLDDPYLV